MDTDLETRLRHGLADSAGDVHDAPATLFADVVAGARRQRRNRLAAVGAVACAVVAAVTVPLVVTGGPTTATPTTATPATTATAPATSSTAPPAVYQRYPYDPRGSLAGDAPFVQGLLDRPWHPADSTGAELPVPGDRQVVFAGAVPGGVQALVIGWEATGWYGWWLHGPAGAAPADLQPNNEANPIDPSLPMSSSWTTDGVGALVVVSRPGDVIEFSRGVQVRADGSIVRDPYERVGDASGVAAVDAAGTNSLTSSVRVSRDGQVVQGSGGAGGGSEGGRTFDPTAALVGAEGRPDRQVVSQQVDQLAEELGLTSGQLQVQALWGGLVGSEEARDAEAVVFTARVPSGATVVVGAFGEDRTDAAHGRAFNLGGQCMQFVLPAGADVRSLALAMRCDFFDQHDGSSLGSRLVVLPPAGSATVELTGRTGQVLGRERVTGPVVLTDVPTGLTGVTARAADGTVLDSGPIRKREDLQPK